MDGMRCEEWSGVWGRTREGKKEEKKAALFGAFPSTGESERLPLSLTAHEDTLSLSLALFLSPRPGFLVYSCSLSPLKNIATLSG